MATDKRARQRENRAQRQAEEAASARIERRKRRARQVAIWAVILIGVLLLANAVWGGSAEAAVHTLAR